LDTLTSVEIIGILKEVGADLNYDVRYSNETPERLIDVAAQRGSMELVELLLGKDVTLTDDTIPCAIASGNDDLVHFLLKRGASIDGIGSLNITPLSAAIRLGEEGKNIFDLLIERRAMKHLGNRKHFASAIRAASEVGDAQIIESLVESVVRLGGEVSPEDLSHALVIAAREGHDEAAQILIEAGLIQTSKRLFPNRRLFTKLYGAAVPASSPYC
jgi:ankyrin repeat protein